MVTVRRQTCSVITDTVGDCDGEAIGDALGVGDRIGDAMPGGVGLGLAVGIGVLLQAATAITAVRTIRLRVHDGPRIETNGHQHDGRRSGFSSAVSGWILTRRKAHSCQRETITSWFCCASDAGSRVAISIPSRIQPIPVQGDAGEGEGPKDRRVVARGQCEAVDSRAASTDSIASASAPHRVTTPSRSVTLSNAASVSHIATSSEEEPARSRRRAVAGDRSRVLP